TVPTMRPPFATASSRYAAAQDPPRNTIEASTTAIRPPACCSIGASLSSSSSSRSRNRTTGRPAPATRRLALRLADQNRSTEGSDIRVFALVGLRALDAPPGPPKRRVVLVWSIAAPDGMIRSMWRREPFRLFFPLGVALAWVGIGHWIAYGAGWIGSYSC